MSRTALITGITGQDGSYLAELLLAKGYRVVGVTRAAGSAHAGQVAHLRDQVELRQGDLRDEEALRAAVAKTAPHEVYHLAADSVVTTSWERPVATADVIALGTVRLLDSVRKEAPGARVVVASSSEIFGRPDSAPQSERSPVRPVTPYGAAKAFAYWMTRSYRERHALHASSAILFNHESARRALAFVTRKISHGVARIATGRATELSLGDLDARRDWGFAGDYVEGMWRMAGQDEADDYVLGSGTTHSVRDCCEIAFDEVGLDYHRHVVIDPTLVRPPDPVPIVADARHAAERLGWRPTLGFEAMIRMMVRADLDRVRQEVT